MLTIIARVGLFTGTALLVFVAQSGFAQTPQRTAATYDDWTVSCVTPPGSESEKSCEMVEAQTTQGQANPVGQITISRPAKNEPFKIFFQVPANVWLQTGITFKEPGGLVATFRWCIPARCLADAELNDAALKKLRARTDPGREEYKDAAQHDVSLPVSFKGFAPALDWMEKQ